MRTCILVHTRKVADSEASYFRFAITRAISNAVWAAS